VLQCDGTVWTRITVQQGAAVSCLTLLCLVHDCTAAAQVADTYLSIALLSTEELVASMAKPHTAVTDAQLKVKSTVPHVSCCGQYCTL
jgi:hypothetical protein